MPTLDSAQAWSRNKSGPMLRDTAILQDLVMPATGRKQADGTGGSTVLMKRRLAGFWSWSEAHRPQDLRATLRGL